MAHVNLPRTNRDGLTNEWDDVEANDVALAAEINGNLDNTNLATGAVTETKIGSGAVTSGKLGDDAVTTGKINDDAVRTAHILDGNVTADKLADAVANAAGISHTDTVRRGKSIIATEESRTNTAFGTLTTPDQVSNVVLPTDGLIAVAFQARVKSSVSGAASAALHLGATQTTVITASTGPTQDAPLAQAAIAAGTVYRPLFSTGAGLAAGSTGSVDAVSDVSTGQIIGSNVSGDGGPCYIFAAAGTYTVSVRFKATSGSVTAKERKLWVWTVGF